MGRLGYAVNGVNSYLYHSFLSTTDSLFGLRYVVLNVSLTTHPQLTLVDSLSVDGESRYIYENRQALPLAIALAMPHGSMRERSTIRSPHRSSCIPP